ncbi:MAG TPA: heavy metal-associated domain-containing protein [Actinomycetes bacterium]|jgi:copper chaperone CopZ|nr:heavy metal-associated domain-containing protein [Actinomycetes bacterium]
MQRSDRQRQEEVDEIVLSVPAMSCRRCVRRISARLGDVPGVVAVEADLSSRTVTVRGRPQLEALHSAVAEAGFEADHRPTPGPSGGLS